MKALPVCFLALEGSELLLSCRAAVQQDGPGKHCGITDGWGVLLEPPCAPVLMGGQLTYTHSVAFSSQNLSWAGQCFCRCFTGEDPGHREVKVLDL